MEEEGRISESSPIMGANSAKTPLNWGSSATKHFDFARILKNLLILSTLGVVFLILYYASCNNNNYYFGRQLFLQTPSSTNDNLVVKDEHYELKKVLKAASTKDNTVILTTLNEAWAAPDSIFDIFLRSFEHGNDTAWLLNHLVVVAVDDEAYVRCQKLVAHCYFLKTNQSAKMAHEARFMSPIYMDMMWGRLALLQTILSLGHNFVFTDTDVMWFRNPFPHFTLNSDFQTSCDHFNGNEFDTKNAPNNGFLFVRSNNRTIEFYKYWVASRHTYPRLHEQDVFNRIKDGRFAKKLGMKLRFLDTDYFGGFCEPSKDYNKVCTMHANCCIGLPNKIADLHTTIEAWKTYLSSNQTTLQPSQWGVPNKCHM